MHDDRNPKDLPDTGHVPAGRRGDALFAVGLALVLSAWPWGSSLAGSCEAPDPIEVRPGEGEAMITVEVGNTCAEDNCYDPSPPCALVFPGGEDPQGISTPGPDAVVELHIPAGKAVDVFATPDGWDLALYVLSSVDPDSAGASCITGVDQRQLNGREVVRDLANLTGADSTRYVVLDSHFTDGFGCGPATLDIWYRDAEGTADDCNAPVAVKWTDDAATLSFSTCSNVDDYDLVTSKCVVGVLDDLVGRDAVIAVTVPDSMRARVRAEPDGWDAALVVSTACSDFAGACVAAVDDGRVGDAEQTPWFGPSGTQEQTFYVLVDSWLDPENPAGCGHVDLIFEREPFVGASGDDCTAPIPLVYASEALEIDAFSCGYAADLDPGAICQPGAGPSMPGRDVVYEVSVDPAEWGVSVTPTGLWDVSLSVLRACDSQCIAISDIGADGTGEALSALDNPTPGTTYYLVIDSAVPPGTIGGCGGYRLRISESATVPTVETSWGALKSRFR